MKQRKLLFISNHAAFFVSHRINIFEHAKRNKYKFHLIFGNPASKKMEKNAINLLNKKKIYFCKLNYSNNKFSIIQDLASILKIINFVRIYKPDIIHSASPKANIYAGVISKFFRKIALVLSFSGMGYLYTNEKKNIIIILKKFLFEITLFFIFSKRKKILIVQNSDDFNLLKKKFNIKKKNIVKIIGGSGIQIEKFQNLKKQKTKNVVMISRVLKNKGALEFFKAAEILKVKFPDWKFTIVGSQDYDSPDKISPDIINYYKKKKFVLFKNYRSDICKILSKTEIFCLPSHREGMPKSIIEALAAGVPVVTTDAIGCRESILPNKNGLLCKSKNHISLANEIEKLILNPKLRNKFSQNAKKYVKHNFSLNEISKKIYKIYDNIINE